MTITDVFRLPGAPPAKQAPTSWVLPMRITTAEGDTVHGAQWPDGRVYAWDADTAWVGAWANLAEFEAQMAEEGNTVDWSGTPADAS